MHTTDLLSDVLQLLLQIAARLHQNFLLIITAYFGSVQQENGSSYRQCLKQMRAGCTADPGAGLYPTKAVLGYRVTLHGCLGEVKISALTNSPQISQKCLKAAGARLYGEKMIIFKRCEKLKHC